MLTMGLFGHFHPSPLCSVPQEACISQVLWGLSSCCGRQWKPRAVDSRERGQKRQPPLHLCPHASGSFSVWECVPSMALALAREVHLVPASILRCGSSFFGPSILVVASWNAWSHGYFCLLYLALGFFITWVTNALRQNNLLCWCIYLKWFLFFGLNTSRIPCQEMIWFL